MPQQIPPSHQSFLHFIRNRELDELYISIALRFFALSMIGIFLPIYLLFELSLPLTIVMYFFIAFSLALAVASFVGAKIASKIGFKHLILLSVPFQITFFLLLILLPTFRIPLFIIAAIGGISSGLYWIGHHTDLAKFTARKKRGEQVGLAFFVIAAATLLGPMIGGTILTLYNFTTLFVTGSLILLISTIPLFLSKEFYEKATFSVKKVFKRGSIKDAAAFTAHGMGIGANNIIWPIFIFIILGKYFYLGLVGTIAGFIAALTSLFIGKVSDKFGKRPFIRLGAFSMAALWFVRTIVKAISQVYLITLFVFIPAATSVPIDTMVYSKARFSRRIEEFLVFREIFINLGKVLIYTILLVTASYVTTFIVTGISQIALILF